MNGTDGAAAAGLQLSDSFGVLIPGAIAFVMGVIMLVALAFAVHRKSWALGVVSAFALIAVIISTVVAMIGGGRLMQKYRVETARGWMASSEDGRFHLHVPGNWKDDEELGTDSAIHLSARMREQYLLVNAFPRGSEVKLKDWATAVNEQMSANVENFTPGVFEESNSGEFPGLHTKVTGRVDGVDVAYHVTYLQLPEEFVYILCWTLKGRERTAFPVFDKVVASFSCTSTDAVTTVPDEKSAPAAERVRILVANQLGVPLEKVTPDAKVAELGADELDTVELVMALEEEFGAEIPDEAAEKLVKVADLVEWAESQKPTPTPDMEVGAEPAAESDPVKP